MIKKAYYLYNDKTIKALNNILSKYNDYDLCIFQDCKYILIDENYYKNVSIECFERVIEDIEDNDIEKLLKNSTIYNETKVKNIIDTLDKLDNEKEIYLSGDDDIIVLCDDNKVTLDFISNLDYYECDENTEYIKI